jgi:hypothetical protein
MRKAYDPSEWYEHLKFRCENCDTFVHFRDLSGEATCEYCGQKYYIKIQVSRKLHNEEIKDIAKKQEHYSNDFWESHKQDLF